MGIEQLNQINNFNMVLQPKVNNKYNNSIKNLNVASTSDSFAQINTDSKISSIYKDFQKAKDQQGLVGNFWDKFKNLTHIGAGSNKAEKAIKDFKNGKITEEEMQKAIDGYKNGQKMCMDVAGDMLSGIISVFAFSLAVPTGGLSLPLGLAIATGVGAASKVLIKGGDSIATGKEYSKKDLLMDAATGGINGLLSPVTNGIGASITKTLAKKMGIKIGAEAAEEVAKQTVKKTTGEAIKSIILTQDVKIMSGSFGKKAVALGAGMAVDGALSNAGDEMTRAAINGDNVLKAGAKGALTGLIMSPIIGGGFKLAGKAGSKIGNNIKHSNVDGDVFVPSEIKVKNDVKPQVAEVNSKPAYAPSKPEVEVAHDVKPQVTEVNSKPVYAPSKPEVEVVPDVKPQVAEASSKPVSASASTEVKPDVDSKPIANNIEVHNAEKEFAEQIKQNPMKKATFIIDREKVDFDIATGTQKGSNKGGFCINHASGEVFYYKSGSEQSKVEVLASKIYKLAGLKTPKMDLVTLPNGETGTISRYLPDIKSVTAPTASVEDGFAMDAFLANWDSVCSNNTVKTPDGDIYRIDFGGTFDFRAQGSKKPFTGIVSELETLINHNINPEASTIFSQMDRTSFIDSLRRVADIDDSQLAKLVKDAGMDNYMETLIQRKQFIKQILDLAELTPSNNMTMQEYTGHLFNQALSDNIKKAKTIEELSDIQKYVNGLQDFNKKQKLQSVLSNQEAQIKKSNTKINVVPKKIQYKELLNKFKENGFVEDTCDGSLKRTLTDEQIDKIEDEIGKDAWIVRNIYEKPLKKEQIEDFQKFLESASGKYLNEIDNNFDNLFIIYSLLSQNNLYKTVSDLVEQNPGYLDIVGNVSLNPANKNTIKAFEDYKGSSYHVINESLREKSKDASVQISSGVKNKIRTISNYIDTQVIDSPIKIYRGEGYEILNNIKIADGKTIDLGKMMQETAWSNDPNEIAEICEFILDHDLTATQPGFMSTSISSQACFNKPVMWELTTAPGTKGVYLEGLNITGSLSSEQELLLQKSSNIKIKDIKFENGKWHLIGEVSN